MPTPDQTRLGEDRAHPRIVALWRALRPLTSVIRFMNSGAHPDDEHSGLLAALAVRDGIDISYVCSTRGEGGQNDIGTEAGADLGALRTREMERAADILGLRLYWLSEGPDDPITDFGFSKSGDETLRKWGRERLITRFAHVLRTERPDILCPTFLDVPGQHGHHRAMTLAAPLAMAAAADPAFPSNLPPWQVKKLYLPAWSGAGQSYDDAKPPPAASLVVPGDGRDPVTGWTWERIGQQSRAFHRTQGMGRWPAPDEFRDWPLHLWQSFVDVPYGSLAAGLPARLGDLAKLPGTEPIAEDLVDAAGAIDEALAAFPDTRAIVRHAADALRHVRTALKASPPALAPEIGHRLAAKELQLGHVLRAATGAEARARVTTSWLAPGESAPVEIECDPGEADEAAADMCLPDGWERRGDAIGPGPDALPSSAYPAGHDPLAPAEPAIFLSFTVEGTEVTLRRAMDAPPLALPDATGTLSPSATVVNLTCPPAPLSVESSGIHPAGSAPALSLQPGWRAEAIGQTIEVTLPDAPVSGLHALPLSLNGAPAQTVRRIAQDHTAPTATATPAVLRVRVLDVRLPEARIGYVGSGNDRVGHWLSTVGADVTDLTDADLQGSNSLAHFDAIVVGIFALRFRAGLAQAMPRIHRWTEAGGTLVTLYHRPWDNWDPDRTPPRRLEIGQPSLRWRVTDETAEVRHIARHPILNEPNPIGPEDWAGWVKERGLYFAKSWSEAYTPLLEMADPGEAPHRGALLAADIGEGRHVHTSLILHHQMEHLVPGAFRLMANIVAPRT